MGEISELKKLASEHYVLFVEDSRALQVRILTFLEKLLYDKIEAVNVNGRAYFTITLPIKK
ncbi:MAG: hypothetical protein KAQ94_02230 [Arcobacteraceae bacterium]|nr:hypothetical protein [Arcobacteraceae bacterium]